MTDLKKRCENCNKVFGPRKLRNGKTEFPSMFKARRYCSQICAAVGTHAQRKVAAAANFNSTAGE